MSKYNWANIFKLFEESNLSQIQFCKEQSINPKYFNLKYSQHRSKQAEKSAFVKANVAANHSPSTLELHVGRCKIVCPETMSIQSFATLVHQLA